MVVIENLVQENEETEGKGNEEDGEKSQDGEERQKHLEIFGVLVNAMKPGKAPWRTSPRRCCRFQTLDVWRPQWEAWFKAEA